MTPHQLAERRIELSAEYAKHSEDLSHVLEQKPSLWMQIRERHKSDKAADREWDASPLGLDEMKLRLKMKAIEKKLSAARTMLEVLEGESKNQY